MCRPCALAVSESEHDSQTVAGRKRLILQQGYSTRVSCKVMGVTSVTCVNTCLQGMLGFLMLEQASRKGRAGNACNGFRKSLYQETQSTWVLQILHVSMAD
jgi:hypothetical protein